MYFKGYTAYSCLRIPPHQDDEESDTPSSSLVYFWSIKSYIAQTMWLQGIRLTLLSLPWRVPVRVASLVSTNMDRANMDKVGVAESIAMSRKCFNMWTLKPMIDSIKSNWNSSQSGGRDSGQYLEQEVTSRCSEHRCSSIYNRYSYLHVKTVFKRKTLTLFQAIWHTPYLILTLNSIHAVLSIMSLLALVNKHLI